MKKPSPRAFLHTLHMELRQKNRVPTLTDVNPFGRQGRDYDPTYSVTCEPLFDAAELLAPYEHGGELHKAVFMALESYGGADTFRDGVLALVQLANERLAELTLAKRYLRQTLAAHNPRSRLSCDIRRLIGMNPIGAKSVEVGDE